MLCMMRLILLRVLTDMISRVEPDLRGEINAVVTPPNAVNPRALKSKGWVSALQGVLGLLPKPKFKTQTALDIYDAVLAGASLATYVSPAIKVGSAAARIAGASSAARPGVAFGSLPSSVQRSLTRSFQQGIQRAEMNAPISNFDRAASFANRAAANGVITQAEVPMLTSEIWSELLAGSAYAEALVGL